MKSRMIMAMASYAVLALLAFATLQDKFRWAVWILLAGLAIKTWISAKSQSPD
jgi:hypothetical protein